jgi:hypothetical protein
MQIYKKKALVNECNSPRVNLCRHLVGDHQLLRLHLRRLRLCLLVVRLLHLCQGHIRRARQLLHIGVFLAILATTAPLLPTLLCLPLRPPINPLHSVACLLQLALYCGLGLQLLTRLQGAARLTNHRPPLRPRLHRPRQCPPPFPRQCCLL